MTWRLGRTRQCAKCPWRKDCNPHEIPNGYREELHELLAITIAEPEALTSNGRAMACHESPVGEEAHCVGWLVHQLGPGNNIPLRLRMATCENAGEITTIGEQHETFEETLP